MMGFKGTGYSTAGAWLHHRCFDFQKIAFIHELPNQLDDSASPVKNFFNVRVGY
jgi:hypothetical protein